MNVLIIGRGGREHSLAIHLKKSKQIHNLYVAPGNGGIAEEATCVSIDEMDIEKLVQFAKRKMIDLTIVGPEKPLNAGIVNRFQEENLLIFAPTKEAAILEGSKHFAKQFMDRYGIPTAHYKSFTNAKAAKAYVKRKNVPLVIKADGLADGKGVVVAKTENEAIRAIEDMMIHQSFQESGNKIVIEEFLEGEEVSLMAFVHKHNVYPMLLAKDHKRAYDHGKGPNTGGMGAFAPVPNVEEEILSHILQVAARGMMQEGRAFTGILYAGLMLTKDGPKVIEFNTRFGDPEIQVVLPLLKNDLLQVIMDVLSNRNPHLQWHNQSCVGVVIATKGYPNTYQTNITLPFQTPSECFVIHSGTKKHKDTFYSNGGRVLLIGAISPRITNAAKTVYTYLMDYVNHEHFFFRQDIGVNV